MGIYIKNGGLILHALMIICDHTFIFFRKSGGFLVNAGHCEVLDVANGKKDVSVSMYQACKYCNFIP